MKINYLSFKKGGFTLIELMVVIAIIGLLTAIVTSNFGTSKAKSRDAKRVSDLAQLQLTLELVFDRCNKYPNDILQANIDTPICYDSASTPYPLSYFISKIPTDNATPYIYSVKTDKYDYVLKASLETNSTSLTDAYSNNITSGYSSNVNCSNHTTAPYDYCVVPK